MCRNSTSSALSETLLLVLRGLSAGKARFLPVVAELEGEAEIVPAENADDVLQFVL
jgi:hypothetical protein